MLQTIMQIFQELYTLALAYALNNWWSFLWATLVMTMLSTMTAFLIWCAVDIIKTWLMTRRYY